MRNETFSTAFTRSRRLSLNWARSVQFTPSQTIYLESIFIVILPSTNRSSDWFLSFMCPRCPCVHLSSACCEKGKVDASWNVMAHTQKPDFFFRRNGRVHLNRRGRQFSRLLAAELCALAVVMLDTLCSEVVWRVLATQSIRQFPLQFPSRASPCAITFQLESTRFGLEIEGLYIETVPDRCENRNERCCITRNYS